MAPNVPALLEAHYAVPALGAILNPLNVRLDARSDRLLPRARRREGAASPTPSSRRSIKAALAQMARPAARRRHRRHRRPARASGSAASRYEDLLAEGDPAFAWPGPRDEWDSLALLYTSGTTGDPKGVVYHHRGAYLNALGNALAFKLAPDSVYLWTLPMFHCCGWTYTWAVTAAGGTHVCLRRVDPALHLRRDPRHRVTHLCGAPIVLNLLIHAPDVGQAARSTAWSTSRPAAPRRRRR